jgi:hypothetical protein
VVKPVRLFAIILLALGVFAFATSLFVQFDAADRLPSIPDRTDKREVPIYVMHRRVYARTQEAANIQRANWLGLAGGGAAVVAFMLLRRTAR